MMAPVNSMALANTTQRTQAVFSSLSFTFTGGAARRKTVNSKYTGTITGGGLGGWVSHALLTVYGCQVWQCSRPTLKNIVTKSNIFDLFEFYLAYCPRSNISCSSPFQLQFAIEE